MRKHVKDFINFLEKETTLPIDSTIQSTTERFFNSYGDPVNVDTAVIDNKMALRVFSCGHRKCKNITGLQIFYGHSSDLSDAEIAMLMIKQAVPKIPIELIDELWLFRK